MMLQICIKWKQCKKKKKKKKQKKTSLIKYVETTKYIYVDIRSCFLPFLTTLVTCKGQ